MKTSMTTQALQTLIHGVLTGYTHMSGPAGKLMWTLVTVEVVLMGIWTAFGEEQVAGLFRRVLGLGIWIWIVQAFPHLAQTLVESLATAALRAGGGGDDFKVMLDPSAIMTRGLKATKPFKDFIDAIPTLDVGDKVAYYLCYLAIIWMYIWMSFCIFYPVIEYYIFVVIGSVLIPFAINKHTRFIADKAINMVVGCGIKLMVLGFCLAIIQPVLSQIKFKNPTTWNEIAAVMLAVASLGYLLYKAPQAAMSMVHGSPGLSGSEVLSGLGRIGMGALVSAPVAATRYLTGGLMGGGGGALAAGAANGARGGAMAVSAAVGAVATASSAAAQPVINPDATPKNSPTAQKGTDA